MSSSMVGGSVAQTASAIVAEEVVGSHVLKIDGYSRTKGLGRGMSIESAHFNVGGYSWLIRYKPNGNYSENTDWISFYLLSNYTGNTKVMARFRFSILDQDGEPVSSYIKASEGIHNFSCEGRSWGFETFITRKALEESPYLKDDCFRVRCDVVVSKEIRTETISRFVMVPPSDLHHHIGRLLSSQVETDVMFQVGDETFAAHRLLLGARSSVFMAELFSQMKDKNTSHIKPRVFKAMLHFIYNDSLSELDSGDASLMAQHLLVAADRYALERLKLICEDNLCYYINTSTVATTLVLAEQHGCKGLKEACFKFLKTPGNLKAIMDSDEFQHLKSSCPSLLIELLANVAP